MLKLHLHVVIILKFMSNEFIHPQLISAILITILDRADVDCRFESLGNLSTRINFYKPMTANV